MYYGKQIKLVATKHGCKDKTIIKTVKPSKFNSNDFKFYKLYTTDTKLVGNLGYFGDFKIDVYRGSTKIGSNTVKRHSEHEYDYRFCTIPKQKKGTKLTVKISNKGYETLTKTITVQNRTFKSSDFDFGRIYSSDTKINGKCKNLNKNIKVDVYKGSKKVGSMKFASNRKTMSCKIPKYKKGTKLTFKIRCDGYDTLTKTVTVINKYYKCKYGKTHYNTHSCGCKYMTSSVRKKLSYYEVYNVKKVKDSCGDYDVQGVFVNNTKRKYRYVEIMVKFYDKNGHVLCTNFTNTLNVSPGEKWNWKVIGCNNSKTSYIKIVQITMNR